MPYPFGTDGNPVDTSSGSRCAPDGSNSDRVNECYLTVTSMAFRAWNRGLAAATVNGANADAPNPFAVWVWNGARWFPDPSFPGHGTCGGDTVVWAGKLDYWLVGPRVNHWRNICRFDGVNFLWEPLAIPQATLDRVPVGASGQRLPGGITSAACFSWNNCWFFGTYGTIVRWDGNQLSDASPDPSQGWLQTAFTSAIARVDPSGNPFGVAVGASGSDPSANSALPSQPDGGAPPQVFGSSGGGFSPLGFTAPTTPRPGDPYRTDLVSVDFGSGGLGWVAGDPAGLRAGPYDSPTRGNGRPATGTFPAPEPSPLLPLSPNGAASGCAGPPSNRFTYTNAATTDPAGAFLWSTVSTVPSTGDALAGGRMWSATNGPGPNEDGNSYGEPVIATARCDGTTTTTRFRIPDPTYTGSGKAPQVAADRAGTLTAVAANAVNDAWGTTSRGSIPIPSGPGQVAQRPHVYRFTDGQPPAAAAGDDYEPRPLQLQFDAPRVILLPPLPEPAPPAPSTTVKSRTVKLPSAIFHVKTKLRGRLHPKLYLSFRLRRPTTVGAQALRRGRVVGSSPMRHFGGKTGELVINLDRSHWPNAVRFVTDAPTVSLKDPGARLTGTVNLLARVVPYRGRRIVSVTFEYAPSGTQTWTTIGTASTAPWSVVFDTTKVAPGTYDVRAVATDSSGEAGMSTPALKRKIGAGA